MTGFEPAASTSQTSRATNCATPRSVKNIEFLRFFRKWSNLWSNHLLCGFCERVECRKSQCLQGFSAFFASGYLGGGVLLPNQARYQLRYIPMFFFAILTGFGLAAARSPRSSNTPPACYSPLLGRSPNALRFSHYLRHLGPKPSRLRDFAHTNCATSRCLLRTGIL